MYCLGFTSESMVVDTITAVCICEEIGNKMMLSEFEKEILYYGTLIHDIGMLAIPREIIEAPRKLEPEEIKLLRTHVDIAGQELSERMKNEVVSIALVCFILPGVITFVIGEIFRKIGWIKDGDLKLDV